jgi:alcohol dehydrogenase (cytochrome c)
VRNSALGFTGATQDLPFYTAGGSELLVFKLGDAAHAAVPRAATQGNGNASPR